MKKILLKGLFVLLLPFSTSAQIYQPFPTDSATWTVDFMFPLPFFNVGHNPAAYFISGDSLYNGLTYQKINKTLDSIPNNQFMSSNIALIREDSNRIYCKYYGFQTIPNEFILYDFNLTVNDTFSIATILGTISFIVSSVDSEYTQTGYRRALNLSHINGSLPFWTPTMRWVEGIGDIVNGVIYPEVPWVDWWAEALCFRKNNVLIWDNNGACWITSESYVDIKPFPLKVIVNNISNDKIELNMELIKGEKNIYIFDSFGKVVKNIKTSSNKVTVKKEELSRGFYLLKINSFKFSSIERFILY